MSLCAMLRTASWQLFQPLVYILLMLVSQFKDIGIHKSVTVFLSAGYSGAIVRQPANQRLA